MLAASPLVLLLAALAFATGAEAVLINDGGAPPDPGHVIDASDPPGADYAVRNVGCGTRRIPPSTASPPAPQPPPRWPPGATRTPSTSPTARVSP